MANTKSSCFNAKVILSLILFAAILIAGCGGSDDATVLPNITGADKITNATSNEPVFASQAEEDKYYADLEARLNEKLAGPAAAPSRGTATGLLKITLAPVTDEIKTIGTYDLASKVIATATVAGMEPKVVTPVWTVYSAAGTLNGTVYTAPAKAETAVFTATYTEDGISKLALFRLKVTGLYSLTLGLTTDEIEMPANYDLAGISVNAKYSDSSSQEVTTSPNMTWALTSGAGVLAGTVYTPAAKVETAVFTASYTEDGVTKTARFSLKVTGLSALTLSKTTDEIKLPAVYDLATITVKAKLSNGEIKDIVPAWALTSGAGSLAGTVYTPAAKPETAVFTASYAEPGAPITKTALFRLTVTGLYSISLSQVTDEIQLPATYDLAAELVVKALYSDKTTQEITTAPNLVWTLTSGAGVLAGTVYTPAAKVETAVFTASYIDAGITKTARFSLKVIGLSSLTLNRTTDEVQSCAGYNLAEKLVLTDKLSDGTTRNITTDPNTAWTLTSGRGVLSGMVYTAPALAETAVITASYTEAGIAKTINFRLKVNSLISLTLSKTTDETLISTPYDLASKLAVFGRFSNGQTVEVTTNPDLKWTISFGSGVLNGAIYTTPERIETTTLVATYTINGVAQSARFALKVLAALPGTKVQLVSVAINKSTDSVQVSGTYDLATLMPIAKYSDKTTGEVALSWIVTSGGGSVAGNIYTAPANVGSVRLMGSCTADDGSVKSVYVTLKVLTPADYNTIDSVSDLIGPDGGSLTLKKGITLKIPAGAATTTSEVVLALVKDDSHDTNFQDVLSITMDSSIKTAQLDVSLESGMKKEDVIALLAHNDDYEEFTELIGTLENNKISYNVNFETSPIISNSIKNYFFIPPFAQIKKIVIEKYNLANWPIEIRSANGDFKRFVAMPKYRQYHEECVVASMLMFIKGYVNKKDTYHSCDLIKYIGFDKLGGVRFWHRGVQSVLEDSVGQITRHNIYSAKNFDLFAYGESLKNKPFMCRMPVHAFLVTGYQKLSGVSYVLINNPQYPISGNNTSSYEYQQEIRSIDSISADWSNLASFIRIQPLFAVYTTKAAVNPNRTLQTIQMPDNTAQNIPPKKVSDERISFNIDENTVVSTLEWNTSGENGYIFTNSVDNKVPDFNFINLKKIPLYSGYIFPTFNKTVRVKTTVSISGTNIYEYPSPNGSNTDAYEFNFLDTPAPNLTPGENNDGETSHYFSHNIYKSKFKQGWGQLGTEFTVKLELLNSNNISIDSFSFKFNYAPLLIKSLTNTIDSKGVLYHFAGDTIKFAAFEGNINLTSSVTWKVENPDNALKTNPDGTFTNGILETSGELNSIKEYTVIAKYTNATTGVTKTSAPIKLKLLPGITPHQKSFISNTDQTFQFTLGTTILDDPSTQLTWSGELLNGIIANAHLSSTGLLSIPARANNNVIRVKATLAKGTRISQDEILENEISTTTIVTIFDIFITPQNAIVDINYNKNPSAFTLTWNGSPSSNITNMAEWSSDNGGVSAVPGNTSIVTLTPTTPGKAIIKALLKKDTNLDYTVDPRNTQMIIHSDVEIIAEVNVAEIKITDTLPLTARIEPVNAIGTPIASYRNVKEFTVSVNGAKIGITPPTIKEGPGHGTIEHISSSNPDILPILHRYRFTPPAALTSSPYYFDSDDIIHIEIKSPQFSNPSTSDKLVIYRPLKQNLTLKHPSGQKSGVGDFIVYSTSERVSVHGFYETFRDDAGNTRERSGNFKLGENTGLHYYYESNGIIGGWYNYYDPVFLRANATGYTYTTNWSGPITQTIVYTLARSSIAVPYAYSVVSSTITSGWAPPPNTLP